MGVLSSIWESVEDAGSTVTKGLEDTWDTVDQVYIDDFLGGLYEGTTSFLEHVYHDVVSTEEWQVALAAAIGYQAGFGGEEGLGGLGGVEGVEGAGGIESAGSVEGAGGLFGDVEWAEYLKKASKLFGGMDQGSGPPQGSSNMRSDNYSSMIGRLNNIITQQINPYEEIVIPTGARY